MMWYECHFLHYVLHINWGTRSTIFKPNFITYKDIAQKWCDYNTTILSTETSTTIHHRYVQVATRFHITYLHPFNPGRFPQHEVEKQIFTSIIRNDLFYKQPIVIILYKPEVLGKLVMADWHDLNYYPVRCTPDVACAQRWYTGNTWHVKYRYRMHPNIALISRFISRDWLT